tara:strand:+ start:240 stop:1160 length:921 start_codon:yes stop_codon:yes gene_type:complete
MPKNNTRPQSKLSVWISATRPKTLLASQGPVLLGLFLAFEINQNINFSIAIITLLCALLMQIGTNLVNDYFDHFTGVDSEKRLGPERVTSKGLLAPEEVKKGFLTCFITSFLFGCILMYVGGYPIIIIGLLSLLMAYTYTGGPFPLSHFALGELVAIIFFGPVAVWGTYFLQTKSFDTLPVLIGLGPGFIAGTLMSINNLRDRISDKKASKLTLAVLLGEERARLLTLFTVILSGFIPTITYFLKPNPYLLLPALTPLLFLKNWNYLRKGPINQHLNIVLAKTGQYLFLYCIFFSLSYFMAVKNVA